MPDAPEARRGSAEYARWALDGSLARLWVDHVDVWMYHRPDGETPIAETIGAMADEIRAGKARYAGDLQRDGGATRGGRPGRSCRGDPARGRREPVLGRQPQGRRGRRPRGRAARALAAAVLPARERPPDGALPAGRAAARRARASPDGPTSGRPSAGSTTAPSTGSRRSSGSRRRAARACSSSRSAGSPRFPFVGSVIAGATDGRAGARERRRGTLGAGRGDVRGAPVSTKRPVELLSPEMVR